MHGHPISKELELFHKEHNSVAKDPAWQQFLSDLKSELDAKFFELDEEHSNDGKFGMSKAGGCTRAAVLKAQGATEDFSGSTKMTFFTGHLLEAVVRATLKGCGYALSAQQEPVVLGELMHSYLDGIIEGGRFNGGAKYGHEFNPAILSVKSAGYKKSGKERRKAGWTFVRRGWPELAFEGVLKSQPGHWAQSQAEMHASGIRKTLYISVAKDIMKNMEDDPYLGPEGNGSLSFYSEVIDYDPVWCTTQLVPTWDDQRVQRNAGKAGPALIFNPTSMMFERMKPGDETAAQNKEASGTFNHCAYCGVLAECKQALVKEWRR